MITSIGVENFSSEIIATKRPVLLACLVSDDAFVGQLDVLNNISVNSFDDSLKVCLLDDY